MIEDAQKTPNFNNCPIFLIPSEMIHSIFNYLRPNDLTACSRTCRKLKDIADRSDVWRRLSLDKLQYPEIPEGHYLWKGIYKHLIEYGYPHTCRQTFVQDKQGTVQCLKIFEDCVLSGSSDSQLYVWDKFTGKPKQTVAGHKMAVKCLASSQDKLLSGSKDHTVRVWGWTENGIYCESVLSKHDGEIEAIATTTSGNFLTFSTDTTSRIWKPDGTSEVLFDETCSLSSPVVTNDFLIFVAPEKHDILRCRLGTESIESVCSDPTAFFCLQVDGNTLFTGSEDGLIRAWDLQTGECNHTYYGHSGPVYSLIITPCEIISGSEDTTIRIWDRISGLPLQILRQHAAPVTHLDLADNTLVSASTDNQIAIWFWGKPVNCYAAGSFS